MQRRMFSAAAAVGLGLALTFSLAPSSLAAQRTSGAAGSADSDPTEIDQCRTLDFTTAEVTPLPSAEAVGARPRYRLTVKGMKPASNVLVELVPLVYIRQPVFWGIEVTGCSSGIGLPAFMPYTATYDFTGTMGTCGIEVIGTTRRQQFDLVGCPSIPLPGTSWVLDPASLGVPVPQDSPITANFSDTTMSGYTSCNKYWAEYAVSENGVFKLGSIATTKRACASDSGQAEAVFLSRLKAVTQVQATRTQLTLLTDGKVMLRFLPLVSAT
jgi:heat shock protein HslJ